MSLNMSFIVWSICVLFSVVSMLSMMIGIGLFCELWCFAVVLFLLLLFSLVLLSFVCSCGLYCVFLCCVLCVSVGGVYCYVGWVGVVVSWVVFCSCILCFVVYLMCCLLQSPFPSRI